MSAKTTAAVSKAMFRGLMTILLDNQGLADVRSLVDLDRIRDGPGKQSILRQRPPSPKCERGIAQFLAHASGSDTRSDGRYRCVTTHTRAIPLIRPTRAVMT